MTHVNTLNALCQADEENEQLKNQLYAYQNQIDMLHADQQKLHE